MRQPTRGDAGKGFSVVADEIRNLAETTSVQSREISAVLGKVIESARHADTAKEASISSFNRISGQIETVARVFSEISGSMNQLREGGNLILHTMTSLQEISRNTRNGAGAIREQTQAISGQISGVANGYSEVVSAIDEIKSGIAEISGTVQHVNRITRDLSESTDVIDRQMEQFRTE